MTTVNQSNWRNTTIMSVILVIIAFIVVALTNILVDPYSIFHITDLRNGYTPNDRFNKVEHVIAHKTQYDSFIIGSSRMGVFSTAAVEHYRSGHHYYNLSVFGGDADDALQMLKALDSQGVTIREVLMGIDVFPFIHVKQIVDASYRHHPYVTGESNFSFYSHYVFAPSLYHSLLKLHHNHKAIPDILVDYSAGGSFELVAFDQRIKSNHTKFINDKFNKTLPPRRGDITWYEPAFTALQSLIMWMNAKGIKQHLFIHPHHEQEALRSLSPKSYEEFIHRIFTITGDIPNMLTTWQSQHEYFYDSSHYRPILADIILKELFGDINRSNYTLTTHADISADS